jgi:hypothetical protein
MITVRVTDDLVLNAGSWLQMLDSGQGPIARITPPAVPMFRQVVDYLEAKPPPPAGYVRLADEARAAVAICLRYVGHALKKRRVLPRHEKAIMRQAQNGLSAAVKAVDYMAFDGAWPPPAGRVLAFMRPFCHPTDWSYTQQSRVVELPLRTDSAP